MKAFLQGALALFIVQAVLVIGASRLIGLVARRMRQPMVIAEIVAGIMLGPSLLGWLAPELWADIFPKESLTFLSMMSQVGLILFMFLVGLEFDATLLRGRGHTSIVISHTSIIVPFALGALIALYLYPVLSDPAVPFSVVHALHGRGDEHHGVPGAGAHPRRAAPAADEDRRRDHHVRGGGRRHGLVHPRLRGGDRARVEYERRGSHHRVRGAVRRRHAAPRPSAHPTARRPQREPGGPEPEPRRRHAAAAPALELDHRDHRHPRALRRLHLRRHHAESATGSRQLLADKLEDLVVVFLLPLFFAYSGLRTEIGLLDSRQAWSICALIIAVACIGKFGGSVVPARLTGLPWREATALGILMNTRGLMELIVLNIGLDLGVISPTLFTMMVLMALVTTFMTTPLLEWVYPVGGARRSCPKPRESPAAAPRRRLQRADVRRLRSLRAGHGHAGGGAHRRDRRRATPLRAAPGASERSRVVRSHPAGGHPRGRGARPAPRSRARHGGGGPAALVRVGAAGVATSATSPR